MSSSRSSDELQQLEEETCRLQMTPMIDVTFLLLIFFMCTLKFKTLDGTLGAYLPKDVGVSSGPDVPLEKLVVRMDVVLPGTKMLPTRDGGMQPYTPEDKRANRRFVYGSDRVVRYRVGPKKGLTREAAFEALSRFQGVSEETKYSIDARDGVMQGEVVGVLDHLVSLGIQDVTFVGGHRGQ